MVSKKCLKDFPNKPGVYFMKDAAGEIIYIGKAASLKKRLASYFLKTQDSIKTKIMFSYVRNISFTETASEHDALVLESELIKEHQPRFNISLKDDKSFPYVMMTHEAFPRVLIGRRKKNNVSADFFGPYTNAKLLRRALNILRKSFPFCSCRRFGSKACLYYDLKLCAGPCVHKISQAAYGRMIKRFQDFLTKKDSDVVSELSAEIIRCSKKRAYEKAACLRDQLEALSILVSLKDTGLKKFVRIHDDFDRIGLKKEPRRIETFDISNISGSFAVGSMVSFYDGQPDKDQYRRFKIRTVKGIDDYAMMKEVLMRRYQSLLKHKISLPDLIVIDGGRGHLEAAQFALKSLSLKIPMIAIAKREELIYTVKQKEPVKFEKNSYVLRLLQSGRDEAHRFALKYHQLLRKKDVIGQR
ncbi:MAG: excinuclease ABC subunit UvrC [Candidatus Omnitrophota bacterium]